MRIIFYILICLIQSNVLFGQFYYHDILSTQETNRDHRLFMINKVKKMIIHSLNPDQTVNHNFLCEESFHEDYHKMTVITKSNQTGQSQLTSYYNGNGQVVRSVDSSISSIDISSYFYDSTGKIKEIKFKSSSGNRSDQSNFSEDHIYTYDTGGKLLMMYRIENNSPFSKVKFICDSAGQVIEEKEIISGKARPSIFYKYNNLEKLTDIYSYNGASGIMRAENMFDYNSQGTLIKSTIVLSDTKGYNIWKYFYSENNLISKEECFDQGKELIGIMLYFYTYKL